MWCFVGERLVSEQDRRLSGSRWSKEHGVTVQGTHLGATLPWCIDFGSHDARARIADMTQQHHGRLVPTPSCAALARHSCIFLRAHPTLWYMHAFCGSASCPDAIELICPSICWGSATCSVIVATSRTLECGFGSDCLDPMDA